MNYREWLKNQIEPKLKEQDEEINLKVYDISDARYDGGIKDVVIVVNGLGGTTDSDDVQVVPIQLTILTGGQYEQNNEGKTTYDIVYDVLKDFCKNNNKKSVLLNDFDYYNHSYMQPYPINPLESDSGTFRINFIVTGSLTITKNINDINELYINNQKIPFLTIRMVYTSALSASKNMKQILARNRVQNSSLTIQLETYNRNNVLSTIMQDIRTEATKANTPLTAKLVFTDGHDETYVMVINDFAMLSDRINPSGASYVLSLY